MTATTAVRRPARIHADPPRRAVAALAGVEARELVLHPLFVGFFGLSALFLALAAFGFGESNSGPDETFVFVEIGGLACVPLGIGTFLACNLAASRARRDRSAELTEAAPLQPHARTVAHLVSVAAAAGAAVVLVVVAHAMSARDGLTVAFAGGPRVVAPTLAELAQGPAFVVAMGFAGIALARWLPRSAVAPVLALAVGLPEMVLLSWQVQGPGRWFAPITHDLVIDHWVDVDPSYSYPVLERIASTAMGWHVGYLVGLTVVLGALAVLRSGTSRVGVGALVAGALAVAAAGLMQVATS